jgi:hypothetical protein
MERRILFVSTILLVLAFAGLGCSASWKNKAPAWGKVQIESKVKDTAKLREIHLTETEKGAYDGTGTGQDGTAYKLKVTYAYRESDGQSEIHWDAEGPSGNHIGGQFAEAKGGGGGFSVGH